MLTDTHCHLNLPDFEFDLDEVIQAARQAGVQKILVPGIDLPSSIRAVELAEQYPGFINAAVGIHPNYSTSRDDDFLDDFRRLMENSSVVAIGEIGLDYYRDFSDQCTQIKTFKSMLSLAQEFAKPVCLHQRESGEDMLEALTEWYQGLVDDQSPLGMRPGVFHSFGGDAEIMVWAEKHEFYLGLSGFVTYKKSVELKKRLFEINANKMVIETDAPYITPEPLRGKRNEPANLKFTVESIAGFLGEEPKLIEQVTSQNAKQLFAW